MYEIKCATREIAGMNLSTDAIHPVRTAFSGGQTILTTDSVQQRDKWEQELKAAGVKPLRVTRENVDPKNPAPALVAKLATAWMPGATAIEDEISVGWDDSFEPTPFVRSVSAYLAAHRKEDGAKFDKHFFKHLD